MAEFDLVVRGNIVLPDRVLENGFVAASNGVIAAIGDGTPPAAKTVHDASGKYVLPGGIDGQVHAGSQNPPEGIERSTMAAAAGGVSTIIDMPYDAAGPVVDAAKFREKVAIVEKEAHVDVGLYATIRKENGVKEIPGLVEAGRLRVQVLDLRIAPAALPAHQADRHAGRLPGPGADRRRRRRA